MKNEIGRKITSLTLMIIMVAGGMTFALPGIMPAAHAANANLFVSAENPMFDNYFNGPMVIEVVIIDPDINDTDEGKGEPDVTMNGKDLRMVQATDGNWYAYFSDRTMAQAADEAALLGTAGSGLDFGTFCANDSNLSEDTDPAIILTDTVGIAVPDDGVTNAVQGVQGNTAIESPAATCDFSTGDTGTAATEDTLNVIRENKQINVGSGPDNGQINLEETVWPFIQLFNINPTGNAIIQYNKGGAQ